MHSGSRRVARGGSAARPVLGVAVYLISHVFFEEIKKRRYGARWRRALRLVPTRHIGRSKAGKALGTLRHVAKSKEV